MRKRLAPLCCLLALLTLTACQADSVGVIRSDDGPTVVISNAAPTPAPPCGARRKKPSSWINTPLFYSAGG